MVQLHGDQANPEEPSVDQRVLMEEKNLHHCPQGAGGEDLQHGPTFVAESTGAPLSSSSWTRSR